MITSTSNAYVKHLRSLRDSARERRSERSLFVEGVRLVATALDAGVEIQVALFAPDQLAGTSEGVALLERLDGRPNCFAASPQAVAAAADTRNPQGIVAAVGQATIEPGRGIRLILDTIQDPGNLGTLLRSAEAAGVGLVLCSRGCADIANPKVIRAAMGAHFALAIQANLEWDAIGAELADRAIVYVADAEATMPYYAADWKQAVALIIGNEAHGVSAEAWSMATQTIGIPIHGRSESLNAGVAGSIILFEALRQRNRGRT
ncbi:MAG: RNA methyltransferase [Oscillochloris sp.]|nr:RNA methyltransferase [Oscillochloris sp.]